MNSELNYQLIETGPVNLLKKMCPEWIQMEFIQNLNVVSNRLQPSNRTVSN